MMGEARGYNECDIACGAAVNRPRNAELALAISVPVLALLAYLISLLL
jgi:hypothetical protein